MKRLGIGGVAWAIGTLVWLEAGEARADVKFEIGPRIGYGVPLGKADGGGGDLNDLIAGQLPLWLDVGARFSDHYYLGLYYSYGFGFLPSGLSDSCKIIEDAGGSCNVHDMRFGIQYLYHISPTEKLDPWVGIGVGYEWLGFSTSVSSQGTSIDFSEKVHGFEFVNLQLGLDVPVAEHVAVGPFVAFTMGEYSSAKGTCTGNACGEFTGASISGDISDKALHEWLMFGGRATFQL